MSFRLSKPSLIEGGREWALFLALSFTLFLLNLGWHYHAYRQFVSHPKIFTRADVLLQYTKRKSGRAYQVLKLRTDDGLTLYTTSRKALNDIRGRNVSVLLFPRKVAFADYLGTPYVPSVVLKVRSESSLRMRLYERIASQHREPWMRELFGALFLALPVSGELRERVTRLGVNHLLALSGFHMGLLWAIVYGAFSLLYTPLQRRLFPWRHRLLDVGLVTIGVLGGYLVLTGMPPSLLRAYAMVVVGWLALLRGIELLSFTFLAFCVAGLVALFPSLLLSVGFWLSVAGVFFIYLFLRWTRDWPKWALFLSLNLWVYLAMLPVVHRFFGTFTPSQWISPVLTILFSFFYPLAILLHLLGLGDVTDPLLTKLLEWPGTERVAEVTTPSWFLALFGLLSLAAVRWRAALYGEMVLLLLFFVYLVEQIA